MTRLSRNRELAKGVNALSRTAIQRKRGTWRYKKGANAKDVEVKEAKPVKEPRFYAADDVKRPIPSRKNNHKPTKLRGSISAGTVLILLAGRFKGKRVVFLKQLASGLLLVSGPFKINGVPLRRVNQAYVIATSTQVDVAAVDTSKVDDSFFKKVEAKSSGNAEEFLTEGNTAKKVIPQERKDLQKSVDAALVKSVGAVPHLKSYLRARFTLTKGQFPHELKF